MNSQEIREALRAEQVAGRPVLPRVVPAGAAVPVPAADRLLPEGGGLPGGVLQK